MFICNIYFLYYKFFLGYDNCGCYFGRFSSEFKGICWDFNSQFLYLYVMVWIYYEQILVKRIDSYRYSLIIYIIIIMEFIFFFVGDLLFFCYCGYRNFL